MTSRHLVNLSDDKCLRIARTAEVIIRKALLPFWRLPKNLYFYSHIRNTINSYKTQCYPLGLADERIVDYLLYVIYKDRVRICESSSFSVTWLFSTSQVERYRAQFISEAGKSGMRYYIEQWMEENGLTMKRLLKVIQPPKPNSMSQYIYMPAEENIKRRWLNTDVGYTMCTVNTTGWSPRSAACGQCMYATECISLTGKRFPELLRIRQSNG